MADIGASFLELPRACLQSGACDTDGRIAVLSTVLLISAFPGSRARGKIKIGLEIGDRRADDAPFHLRDHVRAVEATITSF